MREIIAEIRLMQQALETKDKEIARLKGENNEIKKENAKLKVMLDGCRINSNEI